MLVNVLLICPNRDDASILESWFFGGGSLRVDWASHLLEENTLARLKAMHTPALLLRADGETLQIVKWAGCQQMCPVCLELRSVALRSPEESAALRRGGRVSPLSKQFLTPFTSEVVLSLAEFLMDPNRSHVYGYDVHLPTLRPRRFRLEPDSSCPLCAAPVDDSSAGATVILAFRPKKYPAQNRIRNISELDIQSASYLNPTCGMLGRDFTPERFQSFNAQVSGRFREPFPASRSMAWVGRHSSYRGSLITGLLEGLERHAGLRMRAKRCTVFDSYRNLKAEALDPRSCGTYDPSFIQTQKGLTPFSEDMKMRWIWAYSLSECRPMLVPLQLAYYRDRIPGEPIIIFGNSNGCATGTCLEEAIFFGLLELIERDAFLIHWRARLSPAQINSDSLSDPKLKSLIGRLRRANLDVYLFDARLDIPIPSVAAALLRRDRELGTLIWAMGCSFNPEHAIESALAEAAGRQFGFQQRMQAQEPTLRAALLDFSAVRTMDDHAMLYGMPKAFQYVQFLFSNDVKRSLDETYHDWLNQNASSLDLLEDLQNCIRILATAGLNQVLVVDQTTPEQASAGLHTVRAIVPGMMPLDFGHGSCRAASLSRLYTAPVKLGLRSGGITADELNLAPHPFS